MSSELQPDLRLQIGHVLFIDIVAYSKLLINAQSELLHELNEVVRGTEQFRAAEAAEKLVRIPTGDGMALVFRNEPEAAAECALEIGTAATAETGSGFGRCEENQRRPPSAKAARRATAASTKGRRDVMSFCFLIFSGVAGLPTSSV